MATTWGKQPNHSFVFLQLLILNGLQWHKRHPEAATGNHISVSFVPEWSWMGNLVNGFVLFSHNSERWKYHVHRSGSWPTISLLVAHLQWNFIFIVYCSPGNVTTLCWTEYQCFEGNYMGLPSTCLVQRYRWFSYRISVAVQWWIFCCVDIFMTTWERLEIFSCIPELT